MCYNILVMVCLKGLLIVIVSYFLHQVKYFLTGGDDLRLHRIEKRNRPYALYAFLWALLLAAVIVTPILIYDKGYFLYYGDFNVQEIPFYRLAHDHILSGQGGWSHLTDLGANFVGSYSFYLLGSPFFWLTMLLPSQLVPYSIGFLLMLKLAFCSLSGYIFLRRYVRNPSYAVIGGVLYAFSSFSVYNIFFFHFHEPMIVFPLLLAAFDEYHESGRKGVVALAVCACAVVNYYFFFGQVVFTLIYYLVKLLCGSYRFKLRQFLILAAECILGFLMSMVLLLPAITAITGNYRITELLTGWNLLIYPKTQRYIQIFLSFFFPGDIPAKNNFTASAGGKWASIAAYLPMFSTVFTIGYLRTRKSGFFRRLILILLMMAFIPAFNSLFQALNSAYYARWFYALTLLFAVVTIRSLEHMDEIDFKKGFFPTLAITLAATALIGILPQRETGENEESTLKYGLEQSPTVFWVFCGIALGGLALTYLLYVLHKKKPRLFLRGTALLLSFFVVGYSEIYLWAGKNITDTPDEFMINNALNFGEKVTLDDVHEVRSDFYKACDNLAMYWEVPSIQAFHSIVPGGLMEFYRRLGMERDVASRPETRLYGLRGLLSVKYLFAVNGSEYEKDNDKLPGFDYLRSENGCEIYENSAYLPMGFTFDKYITEDEYDDLSDAVKHLALLKALVLTQEQMAKYRDITGYRDGMYDKLNEAREGKAPQKSYRPKYEDFESITSIFQYDESRYFEDIKALKKNVCSDFRYTKEGFEATFKNNGKDNLLFFSVPYEEGWTATVNGEAAEIERVDIGFMAVRVKGGEESRIVFRYRTPMLKEGVIITCASSAVFLLYLIVNKGFRADRKRRRRYRIKKQKQAVGGR